MHWFIVIYNVIQNILEARMTTLNNANILQKMLTAVFFFITGQERNLNITFFLFPN